MSESRVRVSLTDGTFEFEGSETFVAAQIERFERMIQAAVAVQWPGAIDVTADAPAPVVEASAPPAIPPEPAPTPAPAAPPPPAVAYADMYALTEDGVEIRKAVPGGSWAQKTVNSALLYLFGLQMLMQRRAAGLGDIKDVCQAQGCYDSHNMAAYLKADDGFVFSGKGKRQTVQLSTPGFHAAAQMVADLRAGNLANYKHKRRTRI